MNSRPREVEHRCARALRRHLEAGDEATLNEAYELGRSALAEGLGVLEMALVLARAGAFVCAPGDPGASGRLEAFLLECLSPFEMAHRGAREASEALRRMDERREQHLRAVARELHDQAGQLVATLHVALEGLRPRLVPGGGEHLERAFGLLRQVEDEIRRLAHELRPVILDDLGLMPALRLLGDGMARRWGVAVTIEGSTRGRLPPEVETALYRVAQEALANVGRHSRACGASVELERTDREVVCRIRDDGQGFEPAVVLARGRRRGIGLEGIRERITRLGGALEIRSRPARGTDLVMRIPLEVAHDHACAARG